MRRIASSLRQRLLLGTLLWILASIVATGWLLQHLFSEHLARQFDRELNIHLNQLAANLEFDATGKLLIQPLSDPRLQQPYSGLYWQIDAMPGADAPAQHALRRSRSLWDSTLRVPQDGLGDGERHTHRVSGPNGETLRLSERIFRLAEHPQAPLRLIVATDEKWLQQPVHELRMPLFISLGALAGGLLLAALFQVRAGLSPLTRLRQELSALREGERTALGNDHPAEIQPMVDELNAVLRRNGEFAERARRQAGNLAHAVKTPLAVIANAARAESTPLGMLVAGQIAIASAEIDRHLSRARSAARARHAAGRCAVKPLVDGLVRLMQKVHGERPLDFAVQVGATLEFRGEAE
ncbi:MAG: ATP-binding protein, partial [Azonexus sp.]